jgi:hypothetical protein
MRFFMGTVLAVLVLTATAPAAQVDGAWQASYVNEEGQTRVSTLKLQTDGEKLTGTISSSRGTAQISAGTVRENEISFTVVRQGNGDEARISFTGTIEGDTIKLAMQIRDRKPIAMTAKRSP